EAERDRAKVSGVFVLISKKPTFLADPVVGNETRKHLFTRENGTELGKTFLAKLKANDPDAALLEGVAYVRRVMSENYPATQKRRPGGQPGGVVNQPGRVNNQRGGAPMEGNSIWGWGCAGIGVLLVVWLIFGLIRAFSGMGGGHGGYGGGMGGGMGGGGGGFFTGLLGGLFGAMAGSWIYNNFFGGHHSAWSGTGGNAGD